MPTDDSSDSTPTLTGRLKISPKPESADVIKREAVFTPDRVWIVIRIVSAHVFFVTPVFRLSGIRSRVTPSKYISEIEA